MNIDGILNGYVIDHITAGKAMLIYRHLRLDKLDCSVAIIKNAKSRRLGRKDIIKIDELIPIDLEILGYIDPSVTVNVIRDGALADKKHLALPERVVNVIRCKNPRCITQIEQEIEHVFVLADREKGVYRCHYCEVPHKSEEKFEF